MRKLLRLVLLFCLLWQVLNLVTDGIDVTIGSQTYLVRLHGHKE